MGADFFSIVMGDENSTSFHLALKLCRESNEKPFRTYGLAPPFAVGRNIKMQTIGAKGVWVLFVLKHLEFPTQIESPIRAETVLTVRGTKDFFSSSSLGWILGNGNYVRVWFNVSSHLPQELSWDLWTRRALLVPKVPHNLWSGFVIEATSNEFPSLLPRLRSDREKPWNIRLPHHDQETNVNTALPDAPRGGSLRPLNFDSDDSCCSSVTLKYSFGWHNFLRGARRPPRILERQWTEEMAPSSITHCRIPKVRESEMKTIL